MAESLDTSPIAVSNDKTFRGCHHDSDENHSGADSLTGESESEYASTTAFAKDLEVKVCIPPGSVLEVNLERARNFGDRQDFSNDGGAVPYDCKRQ